MNTHILPADTTTATDFLTVLECKPGKVLTKRFLADGTVQDFTAGFHMRIHALPAGTWEECLESLTLLVSCPSACIVRGQPVDDCPRAGDPNEWVYRRVRSKPDEPANFISVARPWVVYDFDDTTAPFSLEAPEQSIRDWHDTLPAELRAASSAFFPSAKAHCSPTVRGKLVAWYKRPISEHQARAFGVHYHADPSVSGAVQPNFFAAPVFVGRKDPLAGRRTPIVFKGTPAKPPPRGELRATKQRPAPVQLKDLPPGDKGIVAALGPHEALIGCRFALCGKLGGVMRKLGFAREDCAAVVEEWLPQSEWGPRVPWALGAWDLPPDDVSGMAGLVELLGLKHAEVLWQACLDAQRPARPVLLTVSRKAVGR